MKFRQRTEKKHNLIEKNMPADKLLAILKQAEEESKYRYTGKHFHYEEKQEVPEGTDDDRRIYRVCGIFPRQNVKVRRI